MSNTSLLLVIVAITGGVIGAGWNNRSRFWGFIWGVIMGFIAGFLLLNLASFASEGQVRAPGIGDLLGEIATGVGNAFNSILP